MKRTAITVVVFLALVATTVLPLYPMLTATAAPTAPAAPLANARIRVAHASPDAPAVDVWVDGALALENLAFEDISDYLTVAEGNYGIQVVATGTITPTVISATLTFDADVDYTIAATDILTQITPIVLIDNNSAPAEGMAQAGLTTPAVISATLTFNTGVDYTIAATDELANITPIVLIDNNSAPADGMAHVRFVHFSPDAPAVDVALAGGAVLFPNVSRRRCIGGRRSALPQRQFPGIQRLSARWCRYLRSRSSPGGNFHGRFAIAWGGAQSRARLHRLCNGAGRWHA